MQAFALLAWSLAAGALLLALVAIVLAYRPVGRWVWRVHAGLAMLIGLVMAIAAHLTVFHPLIPWWQTGAAYLAALTAPVLATAWAARAASRHSPHRPRWSVGGAAVVTLLGSAAAGAWVAQQTLPQMVIAVQ